MNDTSVADRRLHPGTAAIRFVKALPQTVLLLPFVATRASGAGWWALVPIMAVAAVMLGFFTWLKWWRFRYGVGAGGIVIEHGLIGRTRRSIPFDRVQDVDIERGPLHRLFGLAKVRIETGAGGKDEGVLDSVDLAEADRLRMAVRAGQAAFRGDGVAGVAAAFDPPAPADAAPMGGTTFAMETPRVLLFGLFNFSLVYLAGIYAVLNFFDDVLPFGWRDAKLYVGEARHRVEEGAVTSALILSVVLLAAGLGIVAGVAQTLAREHGFRLTAERAGFRRERGLFTRTEIVIPRRRVQLGLVETGPVRRLFGWFALSFQTLSAGQKGEGGRQPVAPFAREDEVAGIVADARPLRLPPPDSLRPVSRKHVLRALAPRIFFPLLGVTIGGFFLPQLWVGYALVAVLAVFTVLERLRHRFALDGDMLFVQRGWWRQRLWVVPVASAQTVSLSRSVLQRMLGLATVAVDTAGASLLSAPDVEDLRVADAVTLRDALKARMSCYA